MKGRVPDRNQYRMQVTCNKMQTGKSSEDATAYYNGFIQGLLLFHP